MTCICRPHQEAGPLVQLVAIGPALVLQDPAEPVVLPQPQGVERAEHRVLVGPLVAGHEAPAILGRWQQDVAPGAELAAQPGPRRPAANGPACRWSRRRWRRRRRACGRCAAAPSFASTAPSTSWWTGTRRADRRRAPRPESAPSPGVTRSSSWSRNWPQAHIISERPRGSGPPGPRHTVVLTRRGLGLPRRIEGGRLQAEVA